MCRGIRTVDGALAVSDDLLDLSLLLKVGKRPPGEGAVDLQTVDEGGNGDEAVRLDILLELVGGGLVEDDGVLGLVLDCSTREESALSSLCNGRAWLRLLLRRAVEDRYIPLPFDHFFFCFLPPVAAGAC